MNEMRRAALGELLPIDAIEAIADLVLATPAGTKEFHEKMVELLSPHRDDLLRKGVLVEYLAYALEAHVSGGRTA